VNFTLDILQSALVKKLKPGVVKVYDYYEPGNSGFYVLLSSATPGLSRRLSPNLEIHTCSNASVVLLMYQDHVKLNAPIF
jgi:hypothetical protein